jgi:hypothetical protein
MKMFWVQSVFGLKKLGMIGFVFTEGNSEILIHNDSSLPNPSFSFLVKMFRYFVINIKRKGMRWS